MLKTMNIFLDSDESLPEFLIKFLAKCSTQLDAPDAINVCRLIYGYLLKFKDFPVLDK